MFNSLFWEVSKIDHCPLKTEILLKIPKSEKKIYIKKLSEKFSTN